MLRIVLANNKGTLQTIVSVQFNLWKHIPGNNIMYVLFAPGI